MIRQCPFVQPQQAVRTVVCPRLTREDGIQSTHSPAPRTVSWALPGVHHTTAVSALLVPRALSRDPIPSHGKPELAVLTFVLPHSTLSKPSLMLALAAQRPT